MNPGILTCPACSAPLEPGDARCRHCGVPFVLMPCPHCGKPTLLGTPRCHLCGAETLQEGGTLGSCPACSQPLSSYRMGDLALAGCRGCHGVWLEGRIMARLCAHAQVRDTLAERLATTPAPPAPASPVTFRPCPDCSRRMARVVFGQTSGVYLDACRDHGVWFDSGELERILTFLRRLPPEAARAALQDLRVPGPDHAIAQAQAVPLAQDQASTFLMGVAVAGAFSLLGDLFG